MHLKVWNRITRNEGDADRHAADLIATQSGEGEGRSNEAGWPVHMQQPLADEQTISLETYPFFWSPGQPDGVI
jgi:hypothetical protein